MFMEAINHRLKNYAFSISKKSGIRICLEVQRIRRRMLQRKKWTVMTMNRTNTAEMKQKKRTMNKQKMNTEM